MDGELDVVVLLPPLLALLVISGLMLMLPMGGLRGRALLPRNGLQVRALCQHRGTTASQASWHQVGRARGGRRWHGRVAIRMGAISLIACIVSGSRQRNIIRVSSKRSNKVMSYPGGWHMRWNEGRLRISPLGHLWHMGGGALFQMNGAARGMEELVVGTLRGQRIATVDT